MEIPNIVWCWQWYKQLSSTGDISLLIVIAKFLILFSGFAAEIIEKNTSTESTLRGAKIQIRLELLYTCISCLFKFHEIFESVKMEHTLSRTYCRSCTSRGWKKALQILHHAFHWTSADQWHVKPREKTRLNGTLFWIRSVWKCLYHQYCNAVLRNPHFSWQWNRPDHEHSTTVTTEAATAAIELLMMGGKTPETCWAVNKRQDNKLENCCIWLVIYLNWNETRLLFFFVYIIRDFSC